VTRALPWKAGTCRQSSRPRRSTAHSNLRRGCCANYSAGLHLFSPLSVVVLEARKSPRASHPTRTPVWIRIVDLHFLTQVFAIFDVRIDRSINQRLRRPRISEHRAWHPHRPAVSPAICSVRGCHRPVCHPRRAGCGPWASPHSSQLTRRRSCGV
jgi:hypothetical protein